MRAEHEDTSPTLRAYAIGITLALVLTIIPFAATGLALGPPSLIGAVIAVAAVIQILVHLRCFLHLDLFGGSIEKKLILAFALVLIVIMVGGTLWIMTDLDRRMMP